MARYRKNPLLTPEDQYAAFGYAAVFVCKAAVEEIRTIAWRVGDAIDEYFERLEKGSSGDKAMHKTLDKVEREWRAELMMLIRQTMEDIKRVNAAPDMPEKDFKEFSDRIFRYLNQMHALEGAFNEFKRGQGVW